jgi:transmembrane sensor
MANKDFDQLMKRYLTNQVTEAEKLKIEAWLEVMKTENTDDLEMTDEDEQKLFQKIITKRDNLQEIESFKPENLKSKNDSTWILRLAAGLLLIAAIGYAGWSVFNNNTHEASTSEINKVTLNDGTLAWVHGSSKLSYYEKPDGRFAELDGEAFFEVAKDPNRPFTIRYKEVNVQVLGTSFNLKTGDTVELKVLTGKVNFSAQDQQTLEVTPFEKATYSMAEGIRKTTLPKSEATVITNNTEYNMNFVNASVADVLNKLEKKFDVSITLSNPDVKECHVNLDITDHSLDSSLEMIKAVLNIEVQKSGNQITLSGTGCK